MTVTGLLCVMTTLWIFTIVSFLMSVRAASYLLKLKRQLDLNFVGERTHDSRGLEIGGPAPDFPIDSVAGDRALLSTLWAPSGAVLLFVSPSCEHCRLLLAKLSQMGLASWENVIVASDGPRERTLKWLSSIVEEDGAVLSRVITATRMSSRLHATYNPRGRYPYFCAVDAMGVVLAQGDAVTKNPEWIQQLETAILVHARPS